MSSMETDQSERDYTSSDNESVEAGVIKTKQFKCMIVGDMGVGKTSLLATHATGNFPGEHVPTVFGSFVAPFETHGSNTGVDVAYIDTTSQDGYDQYRLMTYNSCDVLMVCFSVSSQSTLENISKKWLPELKIYAPNVPFILVGTKTDVRGSKEEHIPKGNADIMWAQEEDTTSPATHVTYKEGVKAAKRLGGECYVECSAKTNHGVNDVFNKVRDIVSSEVGSSRKRKGSKRKRVKNGLSSFFYHLTRHH